LCCRLGVCMRIKVYRTGQWCLRHCVFNLHDSSVHQLAACMGRLVNDVEKDW
jgi:hypothetical protein